jgi:hypothetical protein
MKDKEIKSQFFKARVTPTEKNLLTAEFNAMGVSYSSWFRQYVMPIIIQQIETRKTLK